MRTIWAASPTLYENYIANENVKLFLAVQDMQTKTGVYYSHIIGPLLFQKGDQSLNLLVNFNEEMKLLIPFFLAYYKAIATTISGVGFWNLIFMQTLQQHTTLTGLDVKNCINTLK